MKTTSITTFASLALAASAAPTDYTPPGGWNSVAYPANAGSNLPSYPAPAGGWENVKYPPGTGAGASAPAASAPAGCKNGPFTFTSTFHVVATPDQVVNGTRPTGGLAGAQGTYDFGLNSDLDLICYNIRLTGFRGAYSSPARTATHIHASARGASGPPRIAFPNPVGDEREATSVGCLRGPFTTGLNGTDGKDTGTGFTIRMLEQNPSAFNADVHSSLALPGAVRGQFA